MQRMLWRSTAVVGLGIGGFALACGLGWLKSYYYFAAFGVDLSLVELSAGDYLLESWFVVQNLLFFVLLWWVILKSRLYWTAIPALLYAAIPIASHYAFAADGWVVADWLIAYRHTLLKFVPFAALLAIWLLAPGCRGRLLRLRWPDGAAPFALLAVISLAWALSTAKHSGSFDARRAQRSPDSHLSRVRLHPSAAAEGLPAADELYLLHAGSRNLVLWDGTGFRDGVSATVRFLVVPREKVDSIELIRTHQLQPGGQYF